MKENTPIIKARKRLVYLDWTKYGPRLCVHRKYKLWIQWTLRGLALLGIASSVIAISEWYLSLSLALVVFAIEQFFERAVFNYPTMFLQPFPKGEFSNNDILGLIYALPKNVGKEPNILGVFFKDRERAKVFFELLIAWNYGSKQDVENNIRISFVAHENQDYSIYFYPSSDRKGIIDSFKMGKQKMLEEDPALTQRELVVFPMYSKRMPKSNNSKFFEFEEDLRTKRIPFYLVPMMQNPDGLIGDPLDELGLMKYHLELKYERNLGPHDMEYENLMRRP